MKKRKRFKDIKKKQQWRLNAITKKKYEKAIIVEETNKILSESVNKYIIDKNLKILGNPIPILDEEFDWDADVFNFKFEIGLSPDLKINFNFKKTCDLSQNKYWK